MSTGGLMRVPGLVGHHEAQLTACQACKERRWGQSLVRLAN